jgi:phosphatidate cytidylyltransferase
VVFSGDSGAYFVGRSLGRTKLYELISPKKTREGSIGGLVASAGFAAGVQLLFIPEISLVTAIALGLGGGILGQLGDLVESMLKRACGVKDSGNLLPGHGGMLDRVDGLIFTLPLFALVLAL